MVTHDVDEAVLLSHKIVMMTNGPSATIGEILTVDLPRPRNRVELAESTQYLHYRKAVIDFLYTRQAHVEKSRPERRAHTALAGALTYIGLETRPMKASRSPS